MIKVIVAEDIEVLRRRIVKEINNTCDIKVVADVGTGLQAVEVASSLDFDVALLDIEMEEYDSGLVAAKEILRNNSDKKIIFLTLNECDEMIFNALESGAVDYVIKSEDVNPIIEHIRKVYANKPELDWNIQNKVQKEFRRLRKSETDLLFFLRNISILTQAEKELLKLLVADYSLKEIAKLRYVELTTIKTQISHILKKLRVRRTKDIVKQIKEMGLESLLESESKV